MEEIESIKNRIKNKRNNRVSEKKEPKSDNNDKKLLYFKNLFSRFMIAIIFILCSIIYVNHSSENLLMYKRHVLNDVWSFAVINNWYNKHLGDVLPFKTTPKEDAQPVFNENLNFRKATPFHDGTALEVGAKFLVPAINSGIVVFIGDNETYGKTVIIQGVDGFDIWYGGVAHNNLKLYDYIEKGSLLGETIGDDLIIVIGKDGSFISYEEYIN